LCGSHPAAAGGAHVRPPTTTTTTNGDFSQPRDFESITITCHTSHRYNARSLSSVFEGKTDLWVVVVVVVHSTTTNTPLLHHLHTNTNRYTNYYMYDFSCVQCVAGRLLTRGASPSRMLCSSSSSIVTRVQWSPPGRAERAAVHLMPCEIEHDGAAQVSQYLTSTIKDRKHGITQDTMATDTSRLTGCYSV